MGVNPTALIGSDNRRPLQGQIECGDRDDQTESRQGDRTAQSRVLPLKAIGLIALENFPQYRISIRILAHVCNVVGSELTINHSVPSWFTKCQCQMHPID